VDIIKSADSLAPVNNHYLSPKKPPDNYRVNEKLSFLMREFNSLIYELGIKQ
jgi:hypothetical protein